jgi:hypothetical protein
MSSASVTRRALSFGAQDSITGWFSKVYTDTTIKGSMQPQGASVSFLPCGNYAKYPHTFFTEYVVHEGDQIVDADLAVYELNTVVKWSWNNKFSHYQCEAVKQDYANRNATSGTWHLDADSLTTDPRSRTKKYFETYTLTGDYILQFDGVDYAIKYLFNPVLGVDTDFLVSCGQEPATALYTDKGYPYAFIEHPTVNLYAVNKSGVTAPRILEQAEQEIRHILTDHPFVQGRSKRFIDAFKYNRVDLGAGSYLWNTSITLKYKRANDDYLPTKPTVTWGASSGTFIFPNATWISSPTRLNNIRTSLPGRWGSNLQKMGMPDFAITIISDVDVNPDNLTWERPQTSTPKTDVLPWQVFLDIQFNGKTEEYQTLDLGWGGTLPVTLEEVTPIMDDGQTTLELTFYVYSASGASAYKTWFGINP